jgi:two-component system OmpR family response regulator
VQPKSNRHVLAREFSASPRAFGPVAPYRVLLIEDHEPLAEATAEFIRSEGLEVRIAATGRDALEIAAEFQPEIVLCDMKLPDMEGLDLPSALRASTGAANAVIALCSAMSETELRALARHSDPPVNMFMSKPLTKENLDALISQLEAQRK